MWMWTVLWGVMALVGLTGTWVTLGARRFARHVADDARALFAGVQSAHPPAPRSTELPAPARRYLDKVLGSSTRSARALRFRHAGRFRSRLDGPWQSIRGQQYFAADPPSFLWWGRMAIAPGVWIDAVDRGIGGRGRMSVSLLSVVTLFDRAGPELDQGAMLRLLSELVLFPQLLSDARYVSWQPLDDARALCTLRVPGSGPSVSGTFEFGHDDLPTSFHAERYLDSGKGPATLLPWSGDYLDYRAVDGVLVPHHFIGYWHVDGRRVAYVDFVLEPPEYDVPEPYR